MSRAAEPVSQDSPSDDLPEGWVETYMGEVAEVVGGGTPKASDPSHFSEEGSPWITPADLSGFEGIYIRKGKRDLSENGLRSCSAVMIPTGSVLLSSRAPIGYLAIAAGPLSTNQGFKSFVCREGIVPEYVYFWLRFIRAKLEAMGSGSTFAEISGRRAKEIPILLPPAAEQQRIAAALEQLLTQMARVRNRLARVPKILKRLRRSVLAAACSGRLTEDWRARHPEGEPAAEFLKRYGRKAAGHPVGDIDSEEGADELPDSWVTCSLESLFCVQTGTTPSRKRADYYEGGTIPWVKTGEIQNCEIFSTEERVTELALEETSLRILPPGTILIAMYGEGRTRGQVGRLRIPATTNQACAALVDDGLPPETTGYLFLYCQSLYAEFREAAVGGNQPNLNLGKVRVRQVNLPPLAE
jgi:type I restriction enzyme S subunit